MSRPVKNLRFMGKAGNSGAPSSPQPKGTMKAFGGVKKTMGNVPIGPGIERASKPRFDQPSVLLNKYDGY